MSELIKNEALILHSIRWHESSKIVTLYTRQQGMLKVIARGALRPKSPFAGRLESLNYIRCVISQKESRELQIITQVDMLDPFLKLKTNLNRLPYALAVAELIKKIFERGHKDEIFFDFLIQTFRAFSKSDQPKIVFWYFLLKFISFLGFKPDFSKCTLCGQTEFKEGGWFVFKNGALYCKNCVGSAGISTRLNQETIKFLRKLQNYNHRKIHEFQYQENSSVDLTGLLIQYLNFHLGHEVRLESLLLLPDDKMN